jgi:hypothetical protein
MPTKFHAPPRVVATALGAAALGSWVIVLLQGLPRWTSGPLCAARGDMLSWAGHCPACWPALALSLMFLTTVFAPRNTPSRAVLPHPGGQ